MHFVNYFETEKGKWTTSAPWYPNLKIIYSVSKYIRYATVQIYLASCERPVCFPSNFNYSCHQPVRQAAITPTRHVSAPLLCFTCQTKQTRGGEVGSAPYRTATPRQPQPAWWRHTYLSVRLYPRRTFPKFPTSVNRDKLDLPSIGRSQSMQRNFPDSCVYVHRISTSEVNTSPAR